MTDHQDHRFAADRPIIQRADDRLGRRGFAEALARAIQSWQGKESLVIALYGPWGVGKSSVKNMAVEALAGEPEPRRPLIVSFNPWAVASRSGLTPAFFDQIGIALGKGTIGSDKERKRVVARWRTYAARLGIAEKVISLTNRPLASVLVVAGLMQIGIAAGEANRWVASAGGALLVTAGAVLWSSRLAGAIADFLAARVNANEQTIEDIKQELSAELARLDRTVLIVVDDVDRLTPSEVLELVQLIKANADFPNLVYLVLADRAILERSVAKVLEVSGREFIEKIVQVGFDVPEVSRSRLDRVLFAGLDDLLREFNVGTRFDQRRWGNLYLAVLQSYFETLRDVHRFLSTLSFHMALLKGETTMEVNSIDLIGLEVLRVFEPEVYRVVARSKELLTRGAEDGGRAEDRRAAITAIINEAPEARRKPVEDMLRQLFPQTEAAFGGATYGGGFAETWYRELRVCSRDVFDRYFALTIPEGDISQSRLDRILSMAGDRARLSLELRSLAADGMLDVALERLEAYKETIALDVAEPFVTAIFDTSEILPEERGGFFSISPDVHATRIVYWYLRRETDAARRTAVVLRAIEQTDGIYLPLRFVSLEIQRAERGDADQVLDAPAREEAKRLCLAKIEAAAEGGNLSENRQLLSILYAWREWAGVEKPRSFIGALIATRDGALRFVSAVLTKTTTFGLGDYVTRDKWGVRLNYVEDFMQLERLEEALEEINLETVDERARSAIEAFRRAVERKRRGLPDDTADDD